MIAYITSVGEPTTKLCQWALERNGFEVVLVEDDSTTLAEKLKQIYSTADDDFVRVDADVIVNNNCKPDVSVNNWWVQYSTFDWYKQDIGFGGVQFIRKEAIETLKNNIDKYLQAERPETQMFRLMEFHDPRRCESNPLIMGIHGYSNDILRAMAVKERRGQIEHYDFELAERLNRIASNEA